MKKLLVTVLIFSVMLLFLTNPVQALASYGERCSDEVMPPFFGPCRTWIQSDCPAGYVCNGNCVDAPTCSSGFECENFVCTFGCTDHDERKCSGGDVYWYDSCGDREERYERCDFGCSGGSCEEERCDSRDEKRCSGGSVYWYDSCGDREGLYDGCDSDETCQGDRCVRFCSEGLIGEKLCSGSEIVQQFQKTDCTTEITSIAYCADGCENGQCSSPKCSDSPDPTDWSQCIGGIISRTNYKCDSTTFYNWNPFTEEELCECGTSEQCDYDEGCKDNVCVKTECKEGEVADNHECIGEPTISTGTIVWIAVGAGAFVFVIIIIVLMVKLKGGQKKRNNGKNKKRF